MRYWLLLFSSLLVYHTSGQTCCSGGVPVSGNLGMPAGEVGLLQVSIAYDQNRLNTLQTEWTRQEDANRTRLTHSALVELGYVWSPRWAVDVLGAFVGQERLIQTQSGGEDLARTIGIGDLTTLLKFSPLLPKPGQNFDWQLGLGVKAPLGATDRAADNGIPFNLDLQPGSGAWDLLVWTRASVAPWQRASSQLFVQGVFSRKGVFREYFGVQAYQFGAEYQLLAGWSDRFLLGPWIIDPQMTLRWRTALEDRVDAAILPNTGGDWLFLIPGFMLWPQPNWALQASLELPTLARVTGTQLTPTYRLQIGFFYRLQTQSTINP
ncbi:MAG: hypothetical protein AAGH79_10480 [Bacteroidota bacterium]